MKSLSPIKDNNDLVTKQYCDSNFIKIDGGGTYCNNLIKIPKLACHEEYHDFVINEYDELVYTSKKSNIFLTLRMDGLNYTNGDQFLIQGIIEKNGKPLPRIGWITPRISTVNKEMETEISDGYFKARGSMKATWLIHTQLYMDVGDTFTIKHLQLYKL